MCDMKVGVSWMLEIHLKEHDTIKEFKCDKCDKDFFLKWRFDSHMRGHNEIRRKFCHFFNNDKNCMFAEVGCKFKHELAGNCKFGLLCRNNLCQYRHYSGNDEASDNAEKKESIDKETNSAFVDTDVNDKTEELREALDQINQLQEDKKDLEDKLRLYGATIRKMRSQNYST